MRVLWALSCRSYELQPDGTVDVEGAGVHTFWVDTLPVDLEANVVIRLAMDEGEEGVIQADFWGPRMSDPQALDIPIEGEPFPGHAEGFEVHMTQPVTFEFEAETEGTYSVELFMPDRRHMSLFWNVRTGPSPWSELR